MSSSSSPSVDSVLLLDRDSAGDAITDPQLKLTNSISSCTRRRPRDLDFGILGLLLSAFVGEDDDAIRDRDMTDGDIGDSDRIEGLLLGVMSSNSDGGCPEGSCGASTARDADCASRLGNLGEQPLVLLSKSLGSLVLRCNADEVLDS